MIHLRWRAVDVVWRGRLIATLTDKWFIRWDRAGTMIARKWR